MITVVHSHFTFLECMGDDVIFLVVFRESLRPNRSRDYPFTSLNADDLLDGIDEEQPVTGFLGVCGIEDGFNRLFQIAFVQDDVDLYLGQHVDLVGAGAT